MNSAFYYPGKPSMDWLRLAFLCWDRVLHAKQSEPAPQKNLRVPDDFFGEGGLEHVAKWNASLDWLDDIWNKIEPRLRAEQEKLARFCAACGGELTPVALEGLGNYTCYADAVLSIGDTVTAPEDLDAWEPEIDGEGQVALPPPLRAMFSAYYAAGGLIASELKCDLVTDSPVYAEAALASPPGGAEGTLAASVLEAYLPADLGSVALERIGALRADMATSRLKYQRDIHGLVTEFGAISSVHGGERLTKHLTDLAHERIEETRRAYRRAQLDIAVTTLGVSALPSALITSLSSILGIGIFAPAGIVASIAAGLAAHLIALEKARDEKARSGWSYVIDVGDALKLSAPDLVPP